MQQKMNKKYLTFVTSHNLENKNQHNLAPFAKIIRGGVLLTLERENIFILIMQTAGSHYCVCRITELQNLQFRPVIQMLDIQQLAKFTQSETFRKL